jgi:hypothetical protein
LTSDDIVTADLQPRRRPRQRELPEPPEPPISDTASSIFVQKDPDDNGAVAALLRVGVVVLWLALAFAVVYGAVKLLKWIWYN